MTKRHALEVVALIIGLSVAGWVVAQATFWLTIAVVFEIWGVR